MPEDINFIDIWEGRNVKIKAVQINNSCSYLDFFDELINKEQTKVKALFHLFDSQNGRIINKQKLKKLNFSCDGCFEFKQGQVRISFVYLKGMRRCVCLLDGFKKKQNEWPKNEKQKTQTLCKKVRIYENMRGKYERKIICLKQKKCLTQEMSICIKMILHFTKNSLY